MAVHGHQYSGEWEPLMHEGRPLGEGAENRRGLLVAGPEFRGEEGKTPKVGEGWNMGSQNENHRTKSM